MDNKISLTKVFEAPIQNVWDAWTKPEKLMQWKAPEGMTTPHAEVDLRVGGSYSVTMEGGHAGPGKQMTVRGTYKEIRKREKLIFTWRWDGQEEETEITLLFKKLSENQTELTLIHSGFVADESRNLHMQGWGSTFEKLAKFLKK